MRSHTDPKRDASLIPLCCNRNMLRFLYPLVMLLACLLWVPAFGQGCPDIVWMRTGANSPISLATTPDGLIVETGSSGSVNIFRASDMILLHSFRPFSLATNGSLAVTGYAGYQVIAVAGEDIDAKGNPALKLKVLRSSDGALLWQADGNYGKLAFTADGNTLGATEYDIASGSNIRLFDTSTRTSADGSVLATVPGVDFCFQPTRSDFFYAQTNGDGLGNIGLTIYGFDGSKGNHWIAQGGHFPAAISASLTTDEITLTQGNALQTYTGSGKLEGTTTGGFISGRYTGLQDMSEFLYAGGYTFYSNQPNYAFVEIYDLSTSGAGKRTVIQTPPARTVSNSTFAVSNDLKTMTLGGYDSSTYNGFLRNYNISDGTLVNEANGPDSSVFVTAYSPDGQIVASGSEDGVIRLWNAADGTLLQKLVYSLNGNDISAVAFTPDGQTLLAASIDGTVKTWRVSDGTLLSSSIWGGLSNYSMTFSPDGKTLAVAYNLGGGLRTYRVSDGSLIRDYKVDDSCYVVNYSPDGNTLAVAVGVSATRLYNVSTGALIRSIPFAFSRTYALSFSPDGKTLAASDQYANAVTGAYPIELRSVADGTLLNTLTEQTDPVRAIRWTPDGQTLLTGGAISTLRLWNATTGALLQTYDQETYTRQYGPPLAASVAFSPDCQTFAYGRDDAVIAVARNPFVARDVTKQVQVTRGGYRYNRASKHFFQTGTITNTGTKPITGPISLATLGLTSNVSLFNKDGVTFCNKPAGSPYRNSNIGGLSVGDSTTFTLEFDDPTFGSIAYTPCVLAGVGSR